MPPRGQGLMVAVPLSALPAFMDCALQEPEDLGQWVGDGRKEASLPPSTTF